jgi:hypothetical protein
VRGAPGVEADVDDADEDSDDNDRRKRKAPGGGRPGGMCRSYAKTFQAVISEFVQVRSVRDSHFCIIYDQFGMTTVAFGVYSNILM